MLNKFRNLACSQFVPRIAFAMTFGGVCALTSQTVSAQGLEEIIVTASKRAQTLQETPIAVMVTSGLAIEQAKVFDIADLQALVPTLKVSSSTRVSGQSFSIRGFGSPTSLGTEPSVGVFVDGVFRSRATGALADLPKLERIEVLSGPQSTLFGKNASAGVISIVTAPPTHERSGSIEASAGNYNHFGMKGRITGGVSDTLAMSLSGGFNERDGYTEHINPLFPDLPDVDDRSRWNLRGQALWEPNDTFSLRVIADFSDIDEICCAQTNVIQGPTQGAFVALGGTILDDSDPFHRTSLFHSSPTSEIEDSGLSVHANLAFEHFTLTSITALRSNEVRTGGHVGGTSINLATGTGTTEIDAFSQELRLTSSHDGPFSWILGGFFYDEEAINDNTFTYGEFLAPYVNFLVGGQLGLIEGAFGFPAGSFLAEGTNVDYSQGQDNTDYSVFGTVDYAVTDALTATVGLNYTRDKKEAFLEEVRNGDVFSAIGALAAGPLGALQIRPPIVGFPNVLEDGKSDDSDTTYQLRLAYELNDSVNFYFSHATGFKSSSWDLSNFSRPSLSLAPALDAAGINSSNPKYGSRLASPEFATVNEIGIKLRFEKFALNVAIFDQSLEDFQVRSFDGVDFFLANAGETSVDGFEFDARYSPTQNWTFTLAGTFLDPVYDDFRNAPPGPNSPLDENGNRLPADLTGQKPLNIHEESIVLGAVYNRSFENGMSMFVRADYQYDSSTQISRDNPEILRKINNLGMSAGLSVNENLSIQLWGRNLTDDENYLTLFGAAAQPGTVSAFINPPRTYGASVIYDFN
ncbi:MAG: TonB-dependent receptor [Pseudomonadota bacterium]